MVMMVTVAVEMMMVMVSEAEANERHSVTVVAIAPIVAVSTMMTMAPVSSRLDRTLRSNISADSFCRDAAQRRGASTVRYEAEGRADKHS